MCTSKLGIPLNIWFIVLLVEILIFWRTLHTLHSSVLYLLGYYLLILCGNSLFLSSSPVFIVVFLFHLKYRCIIWTVYYLLDTTRIHGYRISVFWLIYNPTFLFNHWVLYNFWRDRLVLRFCIWNDCYSISAKVVL